MKRGIVVFILVLMLLTVFSCTSAGLQQQYDKVSDELLKTEAAMVTTQEELRTIQGELKATQNELKRTQSELGAAREEINETDNRLEGTLDELKELRIKLGETELMRDKYDEQYRKLSPRYEELKKQYDAMMEGTANITANAADIEQAIFRLINVDRYQNGWEPLVWHVGLHSCAQANNRHMAETKEIERSECPGLEQMFWFLGYGTTERIAGIVVEKWQEDSYNYRQSVLSNVVNGAVAVHESEGMLYITYLSYNMYDREKDEDQTE